MIVVYKKERDMVISNALLRLSIKLYSQREPKEVKQAFIGVILLRLNKAELNRLREEI